MSKLKASMFDGVRSYNAFLYAIEVFEQLERMQQEGYVFIDGYKPIEDFFFVDKVNLEAGTKKNNCRMIVVGCTFGGENFDKPYMTKSEIDDYTRKLKIIKPSDIKSFKLENKDSKL